MSINSVTPSEDSWVFSSGSEQDTEQFAGKVANAIDTQSALTLHLTGELGAGKTCFSRGFLRGLGHFGSVKSPTYTLVEPYEIGSTKVFHFDLYRLADPEELEFMGIRDYQEQSINLIEWPQQGGGFLPAPDLDITIEFTEQGRNIVVEGLSPKGRELIQKLTIHSQVQS